MTDFIRVFIPVFFTVFFATVFFGASFIVSKRIGKNPNVLPKDDSAYGLIGRYFKITLFSIFVYTVLLFCFPQNISSLYEISLFGNHLFKYLGICLMILSFVWILIAQYQMKNSWRIGIDEELKTDLITSGLFRYSRNPVFFGMLISLAGLFFVLPTIFSIIFFIISNILIQTQVRLEEEFLFRQHGDHYSGYKKNVRRFI